MAEKRIQISAQDSGVRSLMSDIKKQGQETTRAMVNDMNSYASSVDDVNRKLEKQAGLLGNRGGGGGTSSSGSSSSGPTPVIDTAMILAIKEVNKTLVQNHREVIRERSRSLSSVLADDAQDDQRLESAKQSREGTSGGGRDGKDGKSESFFDRMVATAAGTYLGQRGAGIAETMPDRIASLATSQSQYHLAGMLVSWIPYAGPAIASIIDKALSASEAAQASAGSAAALKGVGVGSGMGWRGYHGYGYTSAELNEVEANTSKARGTTAGHQQASMDYVRLAQGFDFEPGSIINLMKSMRGDESGLNASSAVSYLAKQVGTPNGDSAMLEEYADVMLNLGNNQMRKLNSIDVGINAKLIGELKNLGFELPIQLNSMIGALDSGLTNPQSNYAQAISFHVLGQMNPNASRFELLELQEKSLQNPEYLKGVMDFFNTATGGKEELMLEDIKSFFSQLSYDQTRTFVEGYGKEGFDYTVDEDEDLTGQWTEDQMNSRAAGAVGEIEKSTKYFVNNFAAAGHDLVQATDDIKDAFTSATGVLDFFNKIGGGAEHFLNAVMNISTGHPY